MDNAYAKEISKQAIARAGAALGIKSCDQTAVDALADVLRNYIITIGLSARNHAEAGHRCCPGIHDILTVLEQMRPYSVHWKDLKAFALDDDLPVGEDNERVEKWCQPFLFEVPPFPVEAPPSDSAESSLLAEVTSAARDPFVPSHLPAYPPSYTYRRIVSKKRSLEAPTREPDREKRIAVAKSARQSLAKLEDAVDNVE